ncbi:hypothetical protein ACFYLL_17920 [Proteus mirabilis]|uniref:hypothetical protein n=1 Tax=Proteus mirabilis TaxID=584 RepID=UPI0029E517AE|nr:hypothetical protein [Proteus mirabilis]HEK0328230.1 hypothetical protein [Proteus mirabilis]HEK0775612.1 hypothetical protein [Proteus mirabilis]HEK2021492.1 hypothetical protein [Proteus mirabilis]HEK2099953.1 hypothetical protein [Proteus mirabilis]
MSFPNAVKRFQSDIENKLNQLYYMGYVTIERWELLSWFGVERISRTVWNDIVEKWDNWFEDNDQNTVPLQIIRCDGTTATQKYVLIRSDRVLSLPEFYE